MQKEKTNDCWLEALLVGRFMPLVYFTSSNRKYIVYGILYSVQSSVYSINDRKQLNEKERK